MKERKLGELTVSAVGMGCMGFTHGYGQPPPEDEGIRLVRLAYEKGCRLFDTDEVYSNGGNEEFVGKAVKPFRQNVILSTKFSPEFTSSEERISGGKLSEKGIRRALEASLKRLGTDYIDIYFQSRVPADSEPEVVAEIMGKLIREGKIRAWGQSQSTPEQISRAHIITPMSVVQCEYSIMERSKEKDVIPLCHDLGIGFIAFSPIAGGFLSGNIEVGSSFIGNDIRRVITRYAPKNIEANQELIKELRDYAAQKRVSIAQISLAYLMKTSKFVVPIPGMRNEARITENLGAADVILTDAEYVRLRSKLAKIEIHGDRKDSDVDKLNDVIAAETTVWLTKDEATK